MSNNSSGTGHPILGIVLAIIGIIIVLLLGFLLGAIAGGIALLLGIIAVLLGISARKQGAGGKGITAIVFGVIAIVTAVAMTLGTASLMKELKQQATEKNLKIAQYMDKPYLGVMGILTGLPQDEASINEIFEQLNQLNDSSN